MRLCDPEIEVEIRKELFEGNTEAAETNSKPEVFIGFNHILTAISIGVPVQFYNTTFDSWVELVGVTPELIERDYGILNYHFEGLDWRLKPTTN